MPVQAQLPVVSRFIDNWRRREALREMALAAIEPIPGLHQAIQNRLTDIRSGMVAEGRESTSGRWRPLPSFSPSRPEQKRPYIQTM